MAIFKNSVTILGNVVGVKHHEKKGLTRLKVNVPFTKGDGEKSSWTLEVDALKDWADVAKDLEAEKDAVFVRAIIIKRKISNADNVEGNRHVNWLQVDNYDGISPLKGTQVGDGFIEAMVAGRVMKTPELRGDGDKKFCFLNLVYNRPGADRDEEGTFIDVGVFNKSAEKFVTKYVNEGDFAMVTCNLAPRKEDFKVKGREIWTPKLSAVPFAGVQVVTPGGGSGGGGGRGDTSVYEGDDDDLPF